MNLLSSALQSVPDKRNSAFLPLGARTLGCRIKLSNCLPMPLKSTALSMLIWPPEVRPCKDTIGVHNIGSRSTRICPLDSLAYVYKSSVCNTDHFPILWFYLSRPYCVHGRAPVQSCRRVRQACAIGTLTNTYFPKESPNAE